MCSLVAIQIPKRMFMCFEELWFQCCFWNCSLVNWLFHLLYENFHWHSKERCIYFVAIRCFQYDWVCSVGFLFWVTGSQFTIIYRKYMEYVASIWAHYGCLLRRMFTVSWPHYYHLCYNLFVFLFLQITRIEYVHSKGFLHRDIKPDNFLMGLGRKANQVNDFTVFLPYLGWVFLLFFVI